MGKPVPPVGGVGGCCGINGGRAAGGRRGGRAGARRATQKEKREEEEEWLMRAKQVEEGDLENQKSDLRGHAERIRPKGLSRGSPRSGARLEAGAGTAAD